jgi:hypothetical protein
MTALFQFAAFALGTYLSIRMIAALHGVVDVWRMFGKAWPRAVADVVVWAVTTGAIAWLMSGPYRSALVWGLSVYLVFYLSLLPLVRLYVATRRIDRNID